MVRRFLVLLSLILIPQPQVAAFPYSDRARNGMVVSAHPLASSNSQYENNSHKNIHFEQLSMAGIPILPFIKLSAQAFRGSDFSTNVS
ncbi:MAG TPA: hypothetical protein IGS53_04620, partial [Leptolyngbyaceae cyanobacterium M33_DOE_097]|nr:hypothetical protein [Leptolyngbyaceae cyanobacterium M33_DOE_097]